MLGELDDRVVGSFPSFWVELWRSWGWSLQILTMSLGFGRFHASFAIRHELVSTSFLHNNHHHKLA
jgi:hypothetical protein